LFHVRQKGIGLMTGRVPVEADLGSLGGRGASESASLLYVIAAETAIAIWWSLA
jgi:hypothetical protein